MLLVIPARDLDQIIAHLVIQEDSYQIANVLHVTHLVQPATDQAQANVHHVQVQPN